MPLLKLLKELIKESIDLFQAIKIMLDFCFFFFVLLKIFIAASFINNVIGC